MIDDGFVVAVVIYVIVVVFQEFQNMRSIFDRVVLLRIRDVKTKPRNLFEFLLLICGCSTIYRMDIAEHQLALNNSHIDIGIDFRIRLNIRHNIGALTRSLAVCLQVLPLEFLERPLSRCFRFMVW